MPLISGLIFPVFISLYMYITSGCKKDHSEMKNYTCVRNFKTIINVCMKIDIRITVFFLNDHFETVSNSKPDTSSTTIELYILQLLILKDNF